LNGGIADLLPEAVESTGDQITSFGGDGAVSIPKAREDNKTFRSTVTWKKQGSHVPEEKQ
jgi:hypothetical protein